jgi:hypothetical protein
MKDLASRTLFYILNGLEVNMTYYAIKIKMKPKCHSSNKESDIDQICLNNNIFYKKEVIYDHVMESPKSIRVYLPPNYPFLTAVSSGKERYVISEPNKTAEIDGLLRLPRAY